MTKEQLHFSAPCLWCLIKIMQVKGENQMPFLCHFGNSLDRTAAVSQTLKGFRITFPKGLSRVALVH